MYCALKDLHGRQIRVNYATEKRQGFRGDYGGGNAGPGGYGNGSHGGARYGNSNNYPGDGNYGGRSGFGSGNYGFGGNKYGSGSGISPNQGGFAAPELDETASTSYGETEEK